MKITSFFIVAANRYDLNCLTKQYAWKRRLCRRRNNKQTDMPTFNLLLLVLSTGISRTARITELKRPDRNALKKKKKNNSNNKKNGRAKKRKIQKTKKKKEREREKKKKRGGKKTEKMKMKKEKGNFCSLTTARTKNSRFGQEVS